MTGPFIFSKSVRHIVSCFGLIALLAMPAWAQEQCASPDIARQESALRRQYMPGGKYFEKALRNARAALSPASNDTSVYKIPVVVHILHKGEAIGTGTNLSDDVIKGQIQTLNEDYRRKPGTNGFNRNPVGADVGIEFELATCDTNGNYTTGITRSQGRTATYGLGDDAEIKTATLWPPDRYLNVWVCDLELNFLGYSTFPVVIGIPMGVMPGNYIDGVVIDYNAFGKHNQSNNFNLGRTATHEVGHYLGLIHVWGDAAGCSGDDYCPDTPIQEGQINFCPNPSTLTPCPSQAAPMIENYMQYTYDRCMNTFTNDQAYRMRFVMRHSNRHILKDSLQACTTPTKPTDKPNVRAYYSQERTSVILIDNSIDSTSPAILKLFSVDGRLMLEGSSTSRSIEIPLYLPKALYLLKFERGKTKEVYKVVVY